MKKFSYPFLVWMLIFILVPMGLIVFYGVTKSSGGQFILSFDNFIKAFDPVYLNVIFKSFGFALISTVICLLIGYPMAYILAKSFKHSSTAIVFIMIPMWMNFLLRTYAWMAILDVNGILNSFLTFLGMGNIELLNTPFAIVLGMVYNFLPFMILPIYTVLLKMPKDYIEAAQDLGANKKTVFTKVIFPLSSSGIVTGIIMVFMPAVTTFVISRLLGGSKILLLGDLIENQFMMVRDWHFGSTLSLIMLILIIVCMIFVNKHDTMENGGMLM